MTLKFRSYVPLSHAARVIIIHKSEIEDLAKQCKILGVIELPCNECISCLCSDLPKTREGA